MTMKTTIVGSISARSAAMHIARGAYRDMSDTRYWQDTVPEPGEFVAGGRLSEV